MVSNMLPVDMSNPVAVDEGDTRSPLLKLTSRCPEELFAIPDSTAKWWDQTHCQKLTPKSCSAVTWWPPPPEENPLEHPYNIPWSPGWCIQLPHQLDTRSLISHTQYECTWSLKHFFWEENDPPMDKTFFEPPQWDESSLLNCTHIVNFSTGAGGPFDTWLLPETRTLIWDMCWGYLSYGFRNSDPWCNATLTNATLSLECVVPTSRGPEHQRVWDRDLQGTWVPQDDFYQCFTMLYPAPRGTLWGCSDGKMDSHLTVFGHASL